MTTKLLFLAALLFVAVAAETLEERYYHHPCYQDRLKFCPDLQPPFTPERVFLAPCFEEHKEELSPVCRPIYDDFVGEVKLFRTCGPDWRRLCPDLTPPFTPETVFGSQCMADNKEKLSSDCAAMMDEYKSSHPAPPELEQCIPDRLRFCPEMQPPFDRDSVLSAECIKSHFHQLTLPCRIAFMEYQTAHGWHPHVSSSEVPVLETTEVPSEVPDACAADIQEYCGQAPSHHAFFDRCMREHYHELTPACQEEMRHFFLSHFKRIIRILACLIVSGLILVGGLCCCACCLIKKRRCRALCKSSVCKKQLCKQEKSQPAPVKDIEEQVFEGTEMKPVEMYGYAPMAPAGLAPQMPMQVFDPTTGQPQPYVIIYPQYYQPVQQE